MALIVTPGQLRTRGNLYGQLSSLTAAGLGVIQALETIRKNPPARHLKKSLGIAIESIERGSTFTDSIATMTGWTTQFDLALVEAGERSGRLDACLKVLGKYYDERAKLAQSFISEMSYPVFVFHFAALILPFSELFRTGDFVVYGAKVFAMLLPGYAIAAVVLWLMQEERSFASRRIIEMICRCVPVLGKGRQSLALARFTIALEGLLNAGVLVIEALELAAKSSGSPALETEVLGWRSHLERGVVPSDLISDSKEFPDTYASLYKSGEMSGKLHENLPRLFEYYESDASAKFSALARWLPRMFYLGVMLIVAYKVVTFYQEYFNNMNQFLQ